MLILHNDADERHAVAVAGMKLKATHEESILKDAFDDAAGDLIALYIHDDRVGPYLRAEIKRRNKKPHLNITLRDDGSIDIWKLSHILLPVHNKIRLSFGELRSVAFRIVGNLAAFDQRVSHEAHYNALFHFKIARLLSNRR